MGKKSKSKSAPPSRIRARVTAIAALAIVGFLIAQATLVTNPFTPAGHIGYVYEEPRTFGDGGFRGLVQGPGSFGGSLRRHRVVNIDIRPTTHTGSASVPTAEGAIDVEWEASLRPLPDHVQEVVERFGGEAWYDRHVAPIVAGQLRSAVGEHATHSYECDALEVEATLAIRSTLTQLSMPFALDALTVRSLRAPPTLVAAARAPEPEPEPTSNSRSVFPAARQPPPPDDGATLIEVSHRREFRGMWLATIENVDWPSREGLPAEKQREELVTYLDQLQAMNMNALVFQVRPSSDAFYASRARALQPLAHRRGRRRSRIRSRRVRDRGVPQALDRVPRMVQPVPRHAGRRFRGARIPHFPEPRRTRPALRRHDLDGPGREGGPRPRHRCRPRRGGALRHRRSPPRRLLLPLPERRGEARGRRQLPGLHRRVGTHGQGRLAAPEHRRPHRWYLERGAGHQAACEVRRQPLRPLPTRGTAWHQGARPVRTDLLRPQKVARARLDRLRHPAALLEGEVQPIL